MKNKKYTKSIIKIVLLVLGIVVISYFIFTWNRVLAL